MPALASIVGRARRQAGRALVHTGLRRATVPHTRVTRLALPRTLPASGVAYVLIEDTLHDRNGRVRFVVPPAEMRLRSDFVASSIPVVTMTTADGTRFSGLGISLKTGCLELTGLPDAKWLSDFYRRTWGNRSGAQRPDVRTLAEEISRKRSADKVFRYVRPHFPRPGRVLDVGCGYGDQLAVFSAHGWDVSGIEPSETRRAVAREAFGVHTYPGLVEDLGSASLEAVRPGSFDLVVLNQVLEHVPNAADTLAAVRRYLKPDGLLFVAVPDLEMETAFALLNNFIHVRSFTSDALRAELALAGFDVISDAGAPGYNIVTARRSDSVDPAPLARRAIKRAKAHVAWALPNGGTQEELVVATTELTGGRTIIYHRRSVEIGASEPSAPHVIKPTLTGSFRPA
jgi:2-polyprenyl-3-methyl-5-hydroxy-6-metoxy-1,4-benzoquinol methylase